jgi:hypothetical protein
LDGTLGVVFARLRIAEIGEYAVSHVLRDETAVPSDQLRATSVIRSDDRTQVFQIEARR